MKYFFVLGNNKELSLAEIIHNTAFQSGEILDDSLFCCKIKEELSGYNLLSRLGGSAKFGRVEKSFGPKDKGDILGWIVDYFVSLADNEEKGKFCFGLSTYGNVNLEVKRLGIAIKRELQKAGVSSRLVVSQEKQLSSVVVGQNKLDRPGKGAELVFFREGSDIHVARTLAVQPYKDLSMRDYGRPARDDLSGMLPPKLAQMMLNLAGLEKKDDLILDPFCGSGTVITEAALLGYTHFIASDISSKAIGDTKENFKWIKEKFQLDTPSPKLAVKKVADIATFVKENSVKAIVTEPYLGPQRGALDIKAVKEELEYLYNQALREMYKVLQPGGRVVMVWPVIRGKHYLELDTGQFKLVDLFGGKEIKGELKLTRHGFPLYYRENQRVWREIAVLEK